MRESKSENIQIIVILTKAIQQVILIYRSIFGFNWMSIKNGSVVQNTKREGKDEKKYGKEGVSVKSI